MNKYKATILVEDESLSAWFDRSDNEPDAYREAMAWIGRQAIYYGHDDLSIKARLWVEAKEGA